MRDVLGIFAGGTPENRVYYWVGDQRDYLFDELRTAIKDEAYDRIYELIAQIDEKELTDTPLYRQILICARVLTTPEIGVIDAIYKLVEALRMTNKDFCVDRIPYCRMRLDELMIVNVIGKLYLKAGCYEIAGEVLFNAVWNMDEFILSDTLRIQMVPYLLCSLAACHFKLGKPDAALTVINEAKEMADEHNISGIMPQIQEVVGMIQAG